MILPNDRARGKIIKIGTFDDEGNPTDWFFDCQNRVPGVTFISATGETLFANWSLEELRNIKAMDDLGKGLEKAWIDHC